MFKDNCKACFSMNQKNRPAILGTSLTSLEPEPSLKLYMARGKSCLVNKINMQNLPTNPIHFLQHFSWENFMYLWLVSPSLQALLCILDVWKKTQR